MGTQNSQPIGYRSNRQRALEEFKQERKAFLENLESFTSVYKGYARALASLSDSELDHLEIADILRKNRTLSFMNHFLQTILKAYSFGFPPKLSEEVVNLMRELADLAEGRQEL